MKWCMSMVELCTGIGFLSWIRILDTGISENVILCFHISDTKLSSVARELCYTTYTILLFTIDTLYFVAILIVLYSDRYSATRHTCVQSIRSYVRMTNVTPERPRFHYKVASFMHVTLSVLFRYPKRCFIIRFRSVSKPWDLYLTLSDHSEIWQALVKFQSDMDILMADRTPFSLCGILR